MADIENLKRLAEAATPGPWKIHDPIEHAPGANFGVDNAKSEVVVWWGSGYNGIPVTADAEFIAAANPAAILELIAENEALKAEAGECFEDALRHARAADELEVERDPLKAELERVRADAELLRKHLTECADSLESEILDRYGLSKDHPAMRRKFECDMQEVIDARAAMGKGGRADV